MSDQNILIPFPSLYDDKLKVSSIAEETQVSIVSTAKKLSEDYYIFEIIDRLKSTIIPECYTPDGVGAIRFSRSSIKKLKHSIGQYAKVEEAKAYLASLPYIVEIISQSFLLEEHRDREKGIDGTRFPENKPDPHIDRVQRLYGALSYEDKIYRAKTTVQIFCEESSVGKHHGFEIIEIELLNPKTGIMTKSAGDLPLSNNSISIANLIKNVGLSYEPYVNLLDAMRAAHYFKQTNSTEMMEAVYNKARSEIFRSEMASSKSHIIEETDLILGSDWRERLLKIDNKTTNKKKKGVKL